MWRHLPTKTDSSSPPQQNLLLLAGYVPELPYFRKEN
jgi:hypothetical protein